MTGTYTSRLVCERYEVKSFPDSAHLLLPKCDGIWYVVAGQQLIPAIDYYLTDNIIDEVLIVALCLSENMKANDFVSNEFNEFLVGRPSIVLSATLWDANGWGVTKVFKHGNPSRVNIRNYPKYDLEVIKKVVAKLEK